jgi:hypothetical protein
VGFAGAPAIEARVSASRKFQIELTSGTLWASDSPTKCMNDSRSLTKYSVAPSILKEKKHDVLKMGIREAQNLDDGGLCGSLYKPKYHAYSLFNEQKPP